MLISFEEAKELDKLIEENQELSQILQLNNEYLAGVEREKTDLINENKKLKKAIEIIKQYIQLDLECDIFHEIRMGREMIVIPQQEYELLKEVLNND